MASTRVSSKYQVVIPKEIRLQVPIATGQVLQVIAKGGVITLVPDQPLEDLKGFLPDLPTEGFRQKDDRL
jgi:AbrB family looped-hinge helix DNA binding protein